MQSRLNWARHEEGWSVQMPEPIPRTQTPKRVRTQSLRPGACQGERPSWDLNGYHPPAMRWALRPPMAAEELELCEEAPPQCP